MKKAGVILAVLLVPLCARAAMLKIERAVSSSVEEKNANESLKPENAIDGNPKSRWASEWNDPNWIYFDLGSEKRFNVITISWEVAYGRDYELQISNDAQKWRTVYAQKGGPGGTEEIGVGSRNARYVRMYGRSRGTQWGYSIYEFKVELKDDGAVPSEPAGVTLSPQPDRIYVNWDPNWEDDIFGYNVYRSTDGRKGFRKINPAPVRKPKYRDDRVAQGVKYFYYITAVDFPGNESRRSSVTSGAVLMQTKRNYFDIPGCAWKRVLGDIPDKCQSGSPNRGVALGGFGGGSFMYNLSGSFGPFQAMDNVTYKGVWLPGAAFHYYEKIGKGKPEVRTLSTDAALKPSWRKLRIGDAVYYALQPKGWVTYNCFKTDLSQKFFSPIIPDNYTESTYPVAVWQFKVSNPTDEQAVCAVMLTFPGFFTGEYMREENFANTFVHTGTIKNVVIRSGSGLGEWCIASDEWVGSKVTACTDWDGDSDGKDIWARFAEKGEIEDCKGVASRKAAAIAVSVTLKPGEEKVIPIAIAWDFPVTRFGKGTEWWKRYTKFFGKSSTNGIAIAREALQNCQRWEQDVDAWMNPVIKSKKYPEWLKTAAFNELYYSQFGGIFYEGGLKAGHNGKEYADAHPEDGKFFEMECMWYPFANTYDVRHYSSLVYAKFWPDIEKQVQMSFADAIMKADAEHQTPHDVGSPADDPYFHFDTYGTNRLHWKDLHSKFIQQCWRYYYMRGDKDFLSYVWPACKATYGYMKTTDKDGDGLPDNNGSDNTYDAWGLYGTSLLCGGLWVGALEAMGEMAKAMGDPVVNEVGPLLAKARENLDKQLWMEEKGYYRIDTRSMNPTAIMADGLNGQRYCELYGLPDILPAEKMKSHLKQVYRKCVVPLHDFNGDGVGDCGAINGVKEDGKRLDNGQSDEIWTGSSYFLAATMYRAGLEKEALKTAYGVYYLCYEEESTAYWFNTPEAWKDKGLSPRPMNPEQYQRPRAVWELLLEIFDPYKKGAK